MSNIVERAKGVTASGRKNAVTQTELEDRVALAKAYLSGEIDIQQVTEVMGKTRNFGNSGVAYTLITSLRKAAGLGLITIDIK